MLRITIDETPETVFIKLEGRVSGPWADELDRAWSELAPALKRRKVSVDVCGVTYLDQEGKKTLRAIYSQSGADFLTGTPLTEYFAEEAMRDNAQEATEVN